MLCEVEQNLYLLLGIASQDNDDDGDDDDNVVNVLSPSYQHDLVILGLLDILLFSKTKD